MSPGELRVELSRLTGMSEPEWDDFFSLPADAQAVAVENYRDASWVKESDTFGEVLRILGVLATIAGAVAGIASAGTAISNLRAVL